MPGKRKSTGQWKSNKNESSGPLKNQTSSNIKTSGKIQKKIAIKRKNKESKAGDGLKGLISKGSRDKREFSADSNDQFLIEPYLREEEGSNNNRGGLKLDKRRGCSSLDMGYGSLAQNSLAEKLNLPVFMPKQKNHHHGDFSVGSAKKTFTQHTTVTGNTKPLSSLEDHKSGKGIAERLTELFARIEKEEGEPEEITLLKKEISNSFKLSHEGPKTSLHYYRILKLLGKGSFGKVYMASQVLTNRVVAIKCLDKKVIKEESRKNKIMQELLMFKTLAGHPNVIQIYEVFENRKYFFFVMEYASGGDLLHLMKKKGKLTEIQARNIFVQLVKGLRYIHSKGILHRDIKLDNILLNDNEGDLKAKICDFGVSRTISEGETINEQCGTPAYIAPEIIKKKGYKGYSADIWSLGVLLYAMVMGAMPFKANDIEGLHQKIKDRDCDMSDDTVSKEVKDLLERMLTTEPDKRIGLEEVITHAWLKEDPKQQFLTVESPNCMSSPEEFLLHKISRLGFPMEHILTSIKHYSLNHAFACYMTLTKDFL